MAKMKAPKGHGGVSVGGAQYKPDKNGEVDVDLEHVAGAMEHGLVLIGEDDDDVEDAAAVDYSKMKVPDLREAFRDTFHFEPGEANKQALIDALLRGWD